MEMWESRISHHGLKTFRVIRGRDKTDVETRSQLQVALWEERWQRVQQAELKRSQKESNAQHVLHQKEYAVKRSREAKEQLESLQSLLLSSVELDHNLSWDSLKRRDSFPTLRPKRDPDTQLPSHPQRAPLPADPTFSLFEKIFPFLQKRKIEAVNAQRVAIVDQFLAAEKKWNADKITVTNENERRTESFRVAVEQCEQQKKDFESKRASDNTKIDDFREQYLRSEEPALLDYWDHVLNNSQYLDTFPKSWTFDYIATSKTLICDYGLPNLEQVPRLKEVKFVATKSVIQEVLISDTALQKLYDNTLYQICLRTIYELFQSDAAKAISTIVFNGWVNAIDKSTGQDVTNCVISVQVGAEEFMNINLAQVDPKTCFKKLKGISGARLAELTPVAPVLKLNKEDKRFVNSYEVVNRVDDSMNLASMDWQDFENLIRELFEKEFQSTGGEVKITRASRDGGVDAVAFDPDPIRGGKIVIQAKRYTNVVGVSAVRDLYGTVMNEGATKGILVTTADYGQDSYEFAKGKPLTLLSGSELLYLLQKHGHRARIDLVEAKRDALEKERAAKA